ncbi:PEP/pyruvate-binding domain-containing protein [Promethearchaeum syntrophicum]|uniref:pyruvate, water dikinase n=1 Tax=Promethearchaeum syntrophicum TaxID=2594042 RepID=A0A5B9DBF4_9ARCH
MSKPNLDFSSGMKNLDSVLQGILPGDNVVLQVDELEDYIPFVHKFVRNANKEDKPLVYFRFAQHEFLIPSDVHATIIELRPEKGFEKFLSQIIKTIEDFGLGACYVFDCLSDLIVDWYSDVMVGNFFMLTCPYLYKFDTVAYFALFRHKHELKVIKDIQDTAQVVMDIYRNEGSLYVHPLKVFERYSSTLYMLYKWESQDGVDKFITVKNSSTIAQTLSSMQHWINIGKKRHDVWNLTFDSAKETVEGILLGEISPIRGENLKNHLIKMAVVRDDLLFILAIKYFDLEDILEIGQRMIGSEMIGGKSVGMLLAQAILRKSDPYWEKRLEVQDSFYVGAEVYYTYLVKNNCWWLRRKASDPSTFMEGIEETRRKILSGTFPDYIIIQFKRMLDYYGQSPIIVRSSSLQEDAYGNSFSGKYESIFLGNQGTPEERLANFIKAVQRVYASTCGDDALTYRKSRGLLESDEQMALLVQRVSGSIYRDNFFPQAAGTGFSFNPYVWDKKIDPKAGFLRLVFGLGTRAVGRTDDDFTRLVTLKSVNLRAEHGIDEIRQFSQKYVDVLDLKENKYVTHQFKNVIDDIDGFKLDLYASRDDEIEQRMKDHNREVIPTWILTFDKLLNNTTFAEDMSKILDTLQDAYQIPVDIEYTVNFFEDDYTINLLQCRPWQIKYEIQEVEDPGKIKKELTVFKSKGPIIGTSVATSITRLIYVVPGVYGSLTMRDRHAVARLVGQINHHDSSTKKNILLIGPGRWGTSSPSLGIPTTFAEINNVNIIGEIAEMHEGLVPDISLGSHFFNNLVELDMVYFALNPDKEEDYLDREFFQKSPNQLKHLVPNSDQMEEVIKVIDFQHEDELLINLNSLSQQAICYLKNKTND